MADNDFTNAGGDNLLSTDANFNLGHTPTGNEVLVLDSAVADVNLTFDEDLPVAGALDGIRFDNAYSGTVDAATFDVSLGTAGLDCTGGGSATLDLGDGTTWTVTGGPFDYQDIGTLTRGTSTIVLAGVCTITGTTGVYLYNLTVSAGATVTDGVGSGQIYSVGAVTINGSWDASTLRVKEAGTLSLGAAAVMSSGVLLYTPQAGAGLIANAGATVTGGISWYHGNAASVIAPGTYSGIRLYGGSTWTASAGAYSFSNFEFNPTDVTALTIDLSADPTITITGDLGIDIDSSGDAVIANPGANGLTVQGDVINLITGAGEFVANSCPLTLTGTADQNFDPCGTNRWGEVTVDKTAGGVTLDADLYCTALTGTDGTLDTNGFDLDVSGAVALASGFVVSNPAGSTIACATFTADGQDFSLATGAWYINAATSATITGGVTINYLDARGGVEVNAEGCVKGIECYNVNFGVNRRRRLLICGRRAA